MIRSTFEFANVEFQSDLMVKKKTQIAHRWAPSQPNEIIWIWHYDLWFWFGIGFIEQSTRRHSPLLRQFRCGLTGVVDAWRLMALAWWLWWMVTYDVWLLFVCVVAVLRLVALLSCSPNWSAWCRSLTTTMHCHLLRLTLTQTLKCQKSVLTDTPCVENQFCRRHADSVEQNGECFSFFFFIIFLFVMLEMRFVLFVPFC